MRFKYSLLTLLAFAVVASMGTGEARAQAGDTLVVAWGDADGNPIRNALRDAIANDTNRPDNRVYKLERGGFYWIEDPITADGFDLHIVGATSAPAGETDFGPAIIQRVARADQSVTGTMIQNSGDGADVTLKNIWIMGQDDQGILTTYEPLQLNANNANFVFDNVIFDRNNWHHLGVNGANPDVFITNSVFRNLFGPTQQWEGLGIRLEVGADTVVIENNTFLNIGFTPFQSEAAPANYLRFNHNTLVNVGRSLQAGALWKEAYFTNNVFVNPFWHGVGAADLAGAEPDDDPFTGFFGISALPAQYGSDLERRIVLANNSYWRDPAFASYYADTIRAQPLVNDTTMGYFERYPSNMVYRDNFLEVNPGLATYPADVIDEMIQSIRDLRASVIPAAEWFWDPGRDEECFVCNVWPLPEDFSYTNAALLTAGTDGLPLGDLNWFPAAKATFQANKAEYVAEIESMTEAVELDLIEIVEGESGSLEGDAAVETAEGLKYFFMEGGGFIEWTFDLPEGGDYGLNLHTNMRAETQRGQRVKVNGVNLRNNSGFGEYYFCTAAQAGCANPLPNNEWTTVEIRAAGLVEGAGGLTMPAGQNTIRIEPSWGYQAFSGVDVVDAAGNVVESLTAEEAQYATVQAICDEDDYCPQGFRAVNLNNGSVSWTFDAPYKGQYLLRVFYNTASGAQGEVEVNGQTALSSVVFAGDASDMMTGQFALNAGANTITLTAPGLTVDAVHLIGLGAGTGSERDELPEGYALGQNYPNPFNPVTSIQYEVPALGHVSLRVYDVLGREVMTLVDGQVTAGQHTVRMDGSRLSSGVYFYRLQTAVGQQVRTMILMK